MKRRIRQLSSFCMTVLLLLSCFVIGAPQARAVGGISLEGASIRFYNGGSCHYIGSKREPTIQVTIGNNILQKDIHYLTEYGNNEDVGTAYVTVTGIGGYTGSKTATFEILPCEMKESDFEFISDIQKEYDGTKNVLPVIRAKGKGTDLVDVTYTRAEYEDMYAGSQKTIKVYGIGLSGEDSKNYNVASDLVLTCNAGIIMPKELRVEKNAQLAKGATLDLSKLISDVGGSQVTYQFESGDTLGCTLNGSILTAGQTTGVVTVWVRAKEYDVNEDGKPEYAGGMQEIDVSIVEKQDQPSVDLEGEKQTQPAFTLPGTASVTYGQTLSISTAGGAGSGKVTFWVDATGRTGGATIDDNGLFTPTKAGQVLVYAAKAGDDQYKEAKADPVLVTIHQAQLTIQVKNKTAFVGKEVPTLGKEDYTVSGLVGQDTLAKEPTLTYSPTPNMALPGTYTIQAAGAEGPAGGNYRTEILYQPGTFTISEQPLYPITIQTAQNGTVTADLEAAAEETEVTLTVSPAEGFQLERLTASTDSGAVSLEKKEEGIYTFSMPGEAVTVSPAFVEKESELPPFPFADVTEQDWYYDSVYYVFAKGLMNGTSATTFEPGATTTRGMVVTVLYRLEGSPTEAGWSPFTDVDPGMYYAPPVAWAAWNEIVNGYSDTLFGPNDSITREQMATILYRYAQFKGCDSSQQGNLAQFVDVGKVSSYAKKALSWANYWGLIQGKGDGILDPQGLATRAEVAAILCRFDAMILG